MFNWKPLHVFLFNSLKSIYKTFSIKKQNAIKNQTQKAVSAHNELTI